MNVRRLRAVPLALTAVLTPTLAFAHTGVGDTHGFVHGFMHPVTGLDHILAMVTVGILAWQLGGRALWALPTAFLGAMAIGGALGVAGVDLPFVELGIALSVVVLGGAVALGIKAPLAFAIGLAGFFAIFHGHAHGTEMPDDAGGLAYGVGFMLGTTLLHLAGIATGFLAGRLAESRGQSCVRGAGGLICLAGLLIATGIL